ncbi:MAG TPA: tripartite tricarboxylate transporter TctB family protein [Dongiaceae bacterium]|jgi:putative tricarboxylic transport membrane protein
MRALRAEFGLAVCIIVFAAAYLFADSQLPPAHIGDPLGPKAFPALVAGGLIISGLLLFYEIWKKRRAEAASSEAPERVTLRQAVILVAMVAWVALYYYFFESAGYLIATPIFLFGLLSHFHRGHILANIAIAICFAAVVYALFSLLLNVPLPTGPIELPF